MTDKKYYNSIKEMIKDGVYPTPVQDAYKVLSTLEVGEWIEGEKGLGHVEYGGSYDYAKGYYPVGVTVKDLSFFELTKANFPLPFRPSRLFDEKVVYDADGFEHTMIRLKCKFETVEEFVTYLNSLDNTHPFVLPLVKLITLVVLMFSIWALIC